MPIPAWANYKEATFSAVTCATCAFFDAGLCEMFDDTPVEKDYVCDAWSGMIDKQDKALAPMFTVPVPDHPSEDPRALMELLGATAPDPLQKSDVRAAGVAVRAADTGRVLMLQRSRSGRDPAAGQWEFPGGRLNDGEHPYVAAKREWQEEMGTRLPKGKHVGSWRSGVYQGFVHEIPSETSVKLNLRPKERRVLNPDDPDGDGAEIAAWWTPSHMKRSRAVRQELHDSRAWEKVQKGEARAAVLHLRVNGVSRHSSSHHVYRMVTRDGHYVGRTNPTREKARKGDILRVSAAHVGMNPEGDFVWSNPNVESHYTDSAHSWRELAALAGGALAKDFAAGPSGDPPPNGDSPTGAGSTQMPSPGTLAAMTPAATSEVPVGSGPTISDVHRNRPLRNISTAYMNRKVKVRVHKADPEKQLVYGVVLEPNTLDSQDDFMLPDQVEKAAHSYLRKVARGRAAVSKLQHVKQGFFKNKQSVVPVESYIAPVDFTYDGIEMIKKGTWVMCLHCEDPSVWEDVKSGEYTGLSIGGTGIRRSMHVPPTVVDRGYMEAQQPGDWFNRGGGVAG